MAKKATIKNTKSSTKATKPASVLSETILDWENWSVTEQEILQTEIDLKAVIKDYKSRYENHYWRRWAKWYRDYLLDWSQRALRINLKYQSNIKVPLIKQYVDALWVSIYDNHLNFKTTGRNSDSFKTAASAHDFLAWAFNRSWAWEYIMDSAKECTIEWNWYMKVWFKNEVIDHSYKKFIKNKKTWKLEEHLVEWQEVNQYPTVNYVSIFNIFHPFLVKSLEESPVVIERSIIHKDTVLKKFCNMKWFMKSQYNKAIKSTDYLFNYDFDKIKAAAFWDRWYMMKEITEYCEQNWSLELKSLTDNQFFDILMNNYLHIKYEWWFCEVFEYWESWKLKIMVNWVLIYDWVNPLPDKDHPYVWLIFNKIPGIPYGRWIALSLSDIQDIADIMMNLAIDNQKLLVTPMFEKVKWWDLFSEWDWVIEWTPFKVIEVNQKWALTRLDVWNPQMAWLSWWIEFLFQLSEMSEWINSYAIWYQNKVERSATWVSALVQSFKARLLPLVDSLNQALNRIAKKWLLYSVVYYDDMIEIEKTTEWWKQVVEQIDIDNLVWQYNIEFNAQSLKTATREINRETLIQLMNAVLPFAQMIKEEDATKFNAAQFLKDMFENYEVDPNKYFTSSTNEFVKESVKTEKAKMKVAEWIKKLNAKKMAWTETPADIFAWNATAEQIAQESAEANEWQEDLESTPWIDETTVNPVADLLWR